MDLAEREEVCGVRGLRSGRGRLLPGELGRRRDRQQKDKKQKRQPQAGSHQARFHVYRVQPRALPYLCASCMRRAEQGANPVCC